MTDERTPFRDASDAPLDSSGAPRDGDVSGRFGSLLRDALRSSEREASAAPDVAAPDAGRVAGHFAGVGDGDLLDAAADHPSVRRLLVEIAELAPSDRGQAESTEERVGAARTSSGAACERVSASVRASAIAAFGPGRTNPRVRAPEMRAPMAVPSDAVEARATSDVRDAVVTPAELRARGSGRTPWARIAIAATILVVPSVGLLVGGRRADAAVLSLEGLDRVDASGAVETTGLRRLSMGESVVARAGERVGLRLTGGTRVVLGEQSRLSVGCDAPCDGRCGGAVFDVEAGEVAVAASDSTGLVESVALRVRSAGRVDVLAGAARVERDAAGAASLVLRADARVRWSPDAGVAREIVGPATVALSTESDSATSDAPSAAAFHDLDLFDVSAGRAVDAVRIGARRWRIRHDDDAPVGTGAAASAPAAYGSRADVGGASTIRLDLEAQARGRISWPADAPVFGASRLEIRCRVTGDVGASVVLRLEGVDGAATVIPAGAGGGGGAFTRVLLDLPASFRTGAAGLTEMVLSWSARDGGATVWFEGAAFLGADPRDERAGATSESAAGVPGRGPEGGK